MMEDICDGERYKDHALYSTDGTALQIIIYFDELEVCNPIGSNRKKHKLGNRPSYPNLPDMIYNSDEFLPLGCFYFSLGNVHPKFRSKLAFIQLLAVVNCPLLHYHGIDKVMEKMVDDLKLLEEVRGNVMILNREGGY